MVRGAEFFFCPTPRFLSTNLSNEVRMLFCRNRNKRSVILGLRYTIFNIHWTMCPISIVKSPICQSKEKISSLLP